MGRRRKRPLWETLSKDEFAEHCRLESERIRADYPEGTVLVVRQWLHGHQTGLKGIVFYDDLDDIEENGKTVLSVVFQNGSVWTLSRVVREKCDKVGFVDDVEPFLIRVGAFHPKERYFDV